jgi:hypothetical protein
MEAPDLRSEQQSSATRTKNLCKNILLNSPHTKNNVHLHKQKNKKTHTRVNAKMEPRNCREMEMKDAKHEVA